VKRQETQDRPNAADLPYAHGLVHGYAGEVHTTPRHEFKGCVRPAPMHRTSDHEGHTLAIRGAFKSAPESVSYSRKFDDEDYDDEYDYDRDEPLKSRGRRR